MSENAQQEVNEWSVQHPRTMMGTGDLGTWSNEAAAIKLQMTVAMKVFGSRAIRSEFLYKNVQFLKYFY